VWSAGEQQDVDPEQTGHQQKAPEKQVVKTEKRFRLGVVIPS
jgi:hypothetical protein